jgi:hypothetical protein
MSNCEKDLWQWHEETQNWATSHFEMQSLRWGKQVYWCMRIYKAWWLKHNLWWRWSASVKRVTLKWRSLLIVPQQERRWWWIRSTKFSPNSLAPRMYLPTNYEEHLLKYQPTTAWTSLSKLPPRLDSLQSNSIGLSVQLRQDVPNYLSNYLSLQMKPDKHEECKVFILDPDLNSKEKL